MEPASLIIDVNKPYNLRYTVLFHGWLNLPPFEWDSENNLLRRVEDIDSDFSVLLEIKQKNSRRIQIMISDKDRISQLDKARLRGRINRMLNYEKDLNPLKRLAEKNREQKIIDYLDAGGGYPLRGATLFEDVVKTLFTCNASWPFTVKMTTELCRRYGAKISSSNIWGFPDFGDVPRDPQIQIGYRKKYLNNILEGYDKLKSVSETNSGYDLIRSEIQNINGLGPYSTSHIMILLGDYSRIPIDREVASYHKIEYSKKNINKIQSCYEKKWSDWAYAGYKINRITNKKNWIG